MLPWAESGIGKVGRGSSLRSCNLELTVGVAGSGPLYSAKSAEFFGIWVVPRKEFVPFVPLLDERLFYYCLKRRD